MTRKKSAIRHQENLVGSGVATCGARADVAFTAGGMAGVTCPDCRARAKARIARYRPWRVVAQ